MSSPDSRSTQLCGVLLHPATHTLSPTLHARAYSDLGLDAQYEVFDVPPAELTSALKRLQERRFRQLSVSLPHKEAVLSLADSVSDAAHRIGAANTLLLDAGGVHAENTDWVGVVKSLEPHGDWRDRRAAVLGAGGAARAVVYALRVLGCRVTLTNRTPERAARLAAELGASVGELDAPYDLLVNATSVGMHPAVDQSPVPRERLRPGTLIFDIVYAPLETRLLREARERGCRTQDGLDMLVHQAVEQVRLWTGRAPNPASLRDAAERALGDHTRG